MASPIQHNKMILLRKAENQKAEYERPKLQKAENSLGQKYGRKMGAAIFRPYILF